VTAPALTPATWAAARLLTGRLLDLVVDPEGGGLLVPPELASFRLLGVAAEPALVLDGQPVSALELTSAALHLLDAAVAQAARAAGRTPLEVAVELAGLVGRLGPEAAP
jgi:hypothetical protein